MYSACKLEEVDTLLTADAVEWCPAAGLEGVLACGTYQLNQQEATRVGSLLLFNWDKGTKLDRILQNETKKISFGILDMKWKTNGGASYLATATSNGTLHFFQLHETGKDLGLGDLGYVDLKEDAAQTDALHIALSLDWGRHTNTIAVSDSLGQVGVVDLGEAGPQRRQSWRAHGYEAWITCFGGTEDVVYSGGDDCRLCGWDLRMGPLRPSVTCKWHSMGVCSLQVHPSPGNEHLLASGSYDEQFALWDVRKMTTPLKAVSLGGGIWRVKWHPRLPNLAAAACMHNHFCILSTHLDSAHPVDVVGTYKDHTSLAYGIDWCRKSETNLSEDSDEEVFTLASCSFYDHSLHVWKASAIHNK